MKIMKIANTKIRDKTYYKYRINLPKKVVESLNLSNVEVKVRVEDNKIIIEKDLNKSTETKLTDREKKMQKELMKLIGRNVKEVHPIKS